MFFKKSDEGLPAPLNIPTPTPAADRGGPVACLVVDKGNMYWKKARYR